MNASQLQQLLERLSSLLQSENRARLNQYGLQTVQFEALHYLSICNRYSNTPKAVAEYLGLTKGTVSQSIKVLENKGLLIKEQDRKDKRITRLQITASGDDLVKLLTPSPLLASYCEQAQQGEPEAIIENLTSLLRQIQTQHQHKTFSQCHSCRHNQKLGEGKFFCQLTQEPLSATEVELICREHEPKARNYGAQ
ncbi:MarR family winged helix-turn-helix transcriptional regulator [Marinobacter sp.]|uniref:MarR family winged helix-turn-helix transcriptional regulator n=1 Tax=Marinobacter sp. TaxID=50741 RepID=UPI003A91B6A6